MNGFGTSGKIKLLSDQTNFEQAENALAEKLGMDINHDQDAICSLEKRGIWHEYRDGCTMGLVDSRIHAAIPHYGGVDLVKNEGNPLAINENDANGNRMYAIDGKGKAFDSLGPHQPGNMEGAFKDMKELYPGSNIPNPNNKSNDPKYEWAGQPGNSMLKFKEPDRNLFATNEDFEKYKKEYDDLQAALEEYNIDGINHVNNNADFRPCTVLAENGASCHVAINYMSEKRGETLLQKTQKKESVGHDEGKDGSKSNEKGSEKKVLDNKQNDSANQTQLGKSNLNTPENKQSVDKVESYQTTNTGVDKNGEPLNNFDVSEKKSLNKYTGNIEGEITIKGLTSSGGGDLNYEIDPITKEMALNYIQTNRYPGIKGGGTEMLRCAEKSANQHGVKKIRANVTKEDYDLGLARNCYEKNGYKVSPINPNNLNEGYTARKDMGQSLDNDGKNQKSNEEGTTQSNESKSSKEQNRSENGMISEQPTRQENQSAPESTNSNEMKGPNLGLKENESQSGLELTNSNEMKGPSLDSKESTQPQGEESKPNLGSNNQDSSSTQSQSAKSLNSVASSTSSAPSQSQSM